MIEKWMHNKMLEKRYVNAGIAVGNAVKISHTNKIKCVGFDKLFKRWKRLEAEYAKRGYRTISLVDFMEFGRRITKIDTLFHIWRHQNEDAILHAVMYESEDCLNQYTLR